MLTIRVHDGNGLRPVCLVEDSNLSDYWKDREAHPLWIDVTDPNLKHLKELAEQLGFHPLTVEDALNPEHQPKIDEYDGFIFMVFRSVIGIADETTIPGVGIGHCQTCRLAVYLGKGFLVTLHGFNAQAVQEVAHIVDSRDTAIDHHLDQVLHAIVDRMIDQVFPVLGEMEDKIQEIEETIFTATDKDILPTILRTKRELMTLRRVMGQQREMLTRLSRREDLPYIDPKTAVYFRDVLDHAARLEETCIVLTDLATSVAEAHLAVSSNRINEVMKFLTIFSTIWMPLTFIVGVYGMNFHHMPELDVWWFYPFVWILMMAIVVGMMLFFRRKNWL